jgi:hypothetical protein
MPSFFGESHSTRCYGSIYRWPDIIFLFFPKEKERVSVVYFKDLPFESGLETRDDLIPGPKLSTRNEPRITAHRPPLVSSVPIIPDLIGFLTFFNGFLFPRLRFGSARTDRRWNLWDPKVIIFPEF